MKKEKLPILKFKNEKNKDKDKQAIHIDKKLSDKQPSLPVLRFKNRRNNGKNVLYAACPEAEALFYLMRPRLFLEPGELPWVSKMGYQWEITGDKREFKEEMIRIEAQGLDD
jgi:hypothetical protein